MAYDVSRSDSNWKVPRDVATGATVDKTGLVLMTYMESGEEKVKVTAGAGSEVVVGFSMSDNSSETDAPKVELVDIPASSPYEVQLEKIPTGGGGATAQISLLSAAGTAISTQVANAAAVDANTKFHVDATGLLTVHADFADTTMTATYRYTLTAAEARRLYYDRSVNAEMGSEFNKVGVMSGTGEIYTYEFDGDVNWAASAPTIKTGASGIITIGGGGTTVADIRVIHAPTEEDPSLGLAFRGL